MRVLHSPHPQTPETVTCDTYSLFPKTHKLLQVHSQSPYLNLAYIGYILRVRTWNLAYIMYIIPGA